MVLCRVAKGCRFLVSNSFLLLVAMPGAPSSDALASALAPSSLLLVDVLSIAENAWGVAPRVAWRAARRAQLRTSSVAWRLPARKLNESHDDDDLGETTRVFLENLSESGHIS